MKYLLLLICFISVNLYAQDSNETTDDETLANQTYVLEDGLYKALQNCKDDNKYDTDNIKRVVWVNVEDNIINYVGESISWNPQSNLLQNAELLDIPRIEKVKGKFIAKYRFSTNPGRHHLQSQGTKGTRVIKSMRNINCSIEITDDKLTMN